jgi:YidC/Oxa1 family membrane protein insertase
MASCLPSLVQMILLFGVIDVVYKPITHILHISKSVREAAVNIALLSNMLDYPGFC